jgi:hypothetical protein
MTLAELPNDFTPQQFMQLDKPSLDRLPYDIYKWNCQCKGCDNGTTVRDYGIAPFYFLNRNSKYCFEHPKEYWHRVYQGGNFWLCGKHLKFYNRLKKIYGERATYLRLCHYEKARIGELIRKVNFEIEMINE